MTVTIDERGRIMLPAVLRRQLELSPGDQLVLQVGEGAFKAQSVRNTVTAFQGILSHVEADKSWADELIEERRKEAEG